jgi:hypothetical protein
VRRRERVERAQRQVRHVFVDLLRNERDMEEELRRMGRQAGSGTRGKAKITRASSFSPRKADQFFSIFELRSRTRSGEDPGASAGRPGREGGPEKPTHRSARGKRRAARTPLV